MSLLGTRRAPPEGPPAVLLVDGMSILRNTAGAAAHLDRGFCYSFMTQLTATIKKLRPAHVIVCWEGGFGGREKIWDGYKADRRETPEVIRSQRDELKVLLTHLGVDQTYCPGYEADDVIASLANTLPTPVVIYTNDKDFLQLVSQRVRVWQKPRIPGSKARELIGPENFEEMTGYRNPTLWAKAQFALGDPVDGIPKPAGITPMKVHAFLHDMEITANMREKMETFFATSPEYSRNKQLMDLRGVRELESPLVTTHGELSAEGAVNLLYELGFASIVAKFHEWFTVYEGACHSDVSN
jgi:5'-3' exonuclease